MPFSDVAICNLALGRIKYGFQIQSLTEQSQEAAACALAYPFARDCALRDYDWPFAGRFADCSLVQAALVKNWAYSFRLPTNCIKVRRITTGEKSLLHDYPFDMGSDDTGLLLHTDQPSATVQYTHAITDPTLFPPDFASALAWRLAAEVAIPLSTNQALATNAAQRYVEAITSAYTTGQNEVTPSLPPDNEFLASRQA